MSASVGRKKVVRYAVEPLTLRCEWEDCIVIEEDIERFIMHITRGHLVALKEDDLHCHWKDCGGFTESISELNRHILLHAFHTKIKCYGQNLLQRNNLPSCSSSTQSRNMIPELLDPLVCFWEKCLFVCECPEYFYRHMDSHAEHDSKQADKKLVCLWQDCNRVFNDYSKVKEHLRSHTQEKLIACPTCGGMFASRTKFFDHIQRQIPVDESEDAESTYACEYCSKKMNSERLLRDHMRHHVNNYKCPYCEMTCPAPSSLQTHISYRHSENKPHSCPYCDYNCKCENDLRKHLESHTVDAAHKCPVENCSYETRSQTCFNAHFKKVHENKPPSKYCCHLCEKAFSRGNYLTKHLQKEHKFLWPSGHSRFRYCLHEDGVFRLQTVRYESSELSETMMDNSESVDDPNIVDFVEHKQGRTSLEDTSSKEFQEININERASGDYAEFNQNKELTLISDFPEDNMTVGVGVRTNGPLTDETVSSEPETLEQPVLIKILDFSSGNTREVLCEEPALYLLNTKTSPENSSMTYQAISRDSEGKIVYETVEIIPEYCESTDKTPDLIC